MPSVWPLSAALLQILIECFESLGKMSARDRAAAYIERGELVTEHRFNLMQPTAIAIVVRSFNHRS